MPTKEANEIGPPRLGRRALVWAVACVLVSSCVTDELPRPRSGPAVDPEEPAMQLAVLRELLADVGGEPLCVKHWSQGFKAGPVPLPVRFADLPDPADWVVTQLREEGANVLPGSACTVTQRGNTVIGTGARASAIIVHAVVWEDGAAEIMVDLLHGRDGERLSYRMAGDKGVYCAETSPNQDSRE